MRQVDEIVSVTNEIGNDFVDPEQLRKHEMSIAAMHRYVYLAVKEYHNSLSRFLSEHGIALPDLDTLVSSEPPHRD